MSGPNTNKEITVKLTIRRTAAALGAAAALALTTGAALPSSADPVSAQPEPRPSGGDCLWVHTFTADDSDDNYAFPDSGAGYWAASFTVPEGARLDLVGRFAHARYQSLNSYDIATNAPVDALNDVSTQPDAGARNPYLPGASRVGETRRAYTVHVSTDEVPVEGRAANTLYAGVAGQSSQLLLYRVYLPDKGRDATGGTGVPQPRLTLADGRVLTGDRACAALSVTREKPAVAMFPMATYLALRNQPGKPVTFPARQDPQWLSYYNLQFNVQCTYFGLCTGTPARTNQQYANIDNKYVSAQTSTGFGPVLTLRGKLPVTPRTLHRQPRMTADVDMRYWSLCTNESMATTRVEDCVYDEDVITDDEGWYTIVISRAEDRPANATTRCGVNWVEAPVRGDGAGNLGDNLILVRNMLPSPGFKHAVQNTRVPGDERAVMGDYLPVSQYSTVEQFATRGCR